ncbi:MAG: PocR ligand-binding domain-containing protein, partial [Spirochaetales bacterium]|nr:PocR ligand-binding domain-containing protein [Spirochaetales bacterium]
MDKPYDRDSLLARIRELEEKLRSYEEASPGEDSLRQDEDFTFHSLFDPDAIQELQDQFARTVKIGSVITTPDGTPLTRPSNFCHLCEGVIRQTALGLENCISSDAVIGRYSSTGPIVQRCRSGGLWDAGAAIIVKGKHIASWLIGQIRDPSMGDGEIRRYAREIGADEEETAEAFRQVPLMEQEDFHRIADLLYLLANQISELAY